MIRSTGKTKFAYLAAFIALSLCAYCRDAAEIRGASLPWAIPHGAARCGDIVSVALPRKGTALCWAKVDMTAWTGKVVRAAIRSKGKNVSKADETWLGYKFMLHYRDKAAGEELWPGAASRSGSWDWTETEVKIDLRGKSPEKALLAIGLQDASGEVCFDLGSLRIEESKPLFPPDRDRTKCVYSQRVRERSRGRGVMLPSGLCKECDFQTLQAWGVNLVRYQMTRDWQARNNNQDPDEYMRWVESKVAHLTDDVLPWAVARGMEVVVDLHVAPGGRGEDGDMNMFHDARFADTFFAVWKMIATRCKGRAGIWGYDLINEPVQKRPSPEGLDYWSVQTRAASLVREIDPDTPIIVESNLSASPGEFDSLKILDMKDVIYQVHMYAPGNFTHQGVHAKNDSWKRVRYPDVARRLTKETLVRALHPVREFQRRHDAIIYVGEFSAIAWADGAGRYLSDCISLFEEYGWDWTYHAFREWNGWSVEHEWTGHGRRMRPSDDNPRKRALLNGFRGSAKRTDAHAAFSDPPPRNRPVVWWWFNPGASDAAVTRDLEGLARVGVSGFHIYGGSATDPAWKAKVKWALSEANRLGLEGVVCIGAAGCGHRDTEPRHAQKDIVFSTVSCEGGREVRVRLPKACVKETPKNADGSPKFYWDVAVLAVPRGRDTVPVGEVRDVTAFFDAKAEDLTWNAPQGAWTIVRVGYVPKVFGWTGCYIDHMSKEAFDAHWARVMSPLLSSLTVAERTALKGVMCDSWEAGTVSWTEAFPQEFRRRRGYDVLPWLPVKSGLPIGEPAQRQRFERDFALTVGELIAENHYAYQKEVANREGLVSIAEAAGPHQRHGDVRQMQGRCDVAMGEFWMPCAHRSADTQRFMVRDAATAAHVYGLPEVLAESFTTIDTYWSEAPADLKPCADRAFCDGLTRVCYHGMMLSPSLTDRPGRIRNVGIHYNPQNTWFGQSKAFNDYLSRCSWMLSRGRFVADALLYAGDVDDLFVGMKNPADGLGPGYDYDCCPTEILLHARVEDGEVVLPSGMRYRAILLSERNPGTRNNLEPGKRTIRSYPPVRPVAGEAAMRKLYELVSDGATLVGGRPDGPARLMDSETRYREMADALWGSPDAPPCEVRNVGRGRVFCRRERVLAELPPDFAIAEKGTGGAVDWIHRALQDEDIYFIANLSNAPMAFTATFRTAFPQVELWNPVSGDRALSQVARQVRDRGFARSDVALSLPAHGSVFVVFSSARDAPPQSHPSGRQILSGAWSVQFDPDAGGPAQPVQMTRLRDWTDFPDVAIRNYSGTARYRLLFDVADDCPLEGRAAIDLGSVHALVEIVLNGQTLGVAWTPPYRLPCGTALKRKGNELEVRVTNLWPNRLILDAGLPPNERKTRTNINPYKPTDALLPSGLLGPVALHW